MRILVLGAGVLGCNVAADLYDAKKDITLLARGSWYQTIKDHGLCIKDKFAFSPKTRHISVIDHLEADDIYDVIFVSLRYTQLESIVETLRQNGSRNIIFNGNNPTASSLAESLPGKNVMFSFAEVGGNRAEGRVNSFSLHKMTIGPLKSAENCEKLIHQVFEGSKIKLVYESNMGDFLLSHAAFVVPVCFACYHTDGNLKRIWKNGAYINRIIDANIECYTALQLLGHEILPKTDQSFRNKLWRKMMFWFYRLMAATSLGKLCASDHAMSAVDEMAALAKELENVLLKSGVPSPAFDELKQDLNRYLK